MGDFFFKSFIIFLTPLVDDPNCSMQGQHSHNLVSLYLEVELKSISVRVLLENIKLAFYFF